MQENYRDANSTFIPWRERNQKTRKSAMHKRPTIKIVELIRTTLVIHVQTTKSITSPLLSSPLLPQLCSTKTRSHAPPRFRELNHIPSPPPVCKTGVAPTPWLQDKYWVMSEHKMDACARLLLLHTASRSRPLFQEMAVPMEGSLADVGKLPTDLQSTMTQFGTSR